jgi:YidC/Oxa1 family membrane protein insertase
VIIKVLLLPLSISVAKNQRAMKEIDPEIKALQKTYKDDREKQAREMFALYKKHNIKPFASVLIALIQIPIIISLYWVFRTESLPQIDLSLLYPFVGAPEAISPLFLGLIFVTGHSILLAVIAAITQFAQAWYAIPVPPASVEAGPKSMQEDFMRAMTIQARYILPLLIGVVAYTSGAIALYFITSSLVALAQELYVRRRYGVLSPTAPASI